jgi:hypothetical protein
VLCQNFQELERREGKVKAKEAELSALEQTTESKLKMAQQKVLSPNVQLIKSCIMLASAHHEDSPAKGAVMLFWKSFLLQHACLNSSKR